MAGIPAIGALNAALESERIVAEISSRTLRLQLDTAEQLGSAAVRLIEAAAIDPEIGRTIDFSI